MKKRGLIIAFVAVCAVLFVYIMVSVIMGWPLPIDKLGELLSQRRIRFFDWFFKIFTYIGSLYFMIGVALIWFIFDKDKKRALSVMLCLAVVGIMNLLLKISVGRVRPDYGLIEETGKSFPSGHAMISLCFYGYIGYLLSKIRPALLPWYIIVSNIIVLLLGFSRIYLGVHYVSDVIAGWCMGYIVQCVFIAIYSKIRYKK